LSETVGLVFLFVVYFSSYYYCVSVK